jgi:hypothetical protein
MTRKAVWVFADERLLSTFWKTAGLWNAEVAAAGPTNNCGICAHVTHVARADEKRLFTFAQCTVLQRGDGAVGDRG